MAIVGNIIKAALEITDKILPESSPIEAQREVLQQLLTRASQTEFGIHYGFKQMLSAKNPEQAFASGVPFHDYDEMNRKWWRRQRKEGLGNITWPGTVPYYALSAGTTGKESKRIPVTDDMLESVRKTSILQILSTSNFNLPAEFFEKEIMMLGSTTRLKRSGKHLEGEISGISAQNIPSWFERFYRPGKKISAISNWDKRVEIIAKQAKNWDIGAMAGIPSWNELMIKKVMEFHHADSIHDVWPNFRVFASGGVAFGPYKKSFEKLLKYPVVFMDTYLASEGFMAFQSRPSENMPMALSCNSGIYFEFVPFDDNHVDENGQIKAGVKALDISQVEAGRDYVLIVSTVAGAWRYMIGDTIRFTDTSRAEIIITGRTSHFLNVVGSQLSVFQMNKAIKQLENQFGLRIPEFTVSAVKQGEQYFHHWYLGTEDHAPISEMEESLDQTLSSMNKAYKTARGKALRGIKVNIVPPQAFRDWISTLKSKGGQVKIPRVMNEELFGQWEQFLKTT